MKGEKRYIIFLVLTFLGIIFLSINPSFTGSSIKEANSINEIIIDDALAGTIIIEDLNLEFSDNGLVKGEIFVTGDVEDWIYVEENFEALPGEEYNFPVVVKIPKNTVNGNYDAKLMIMVVEQGGISLLEDQIIHYVDILLKVNDKEIEGTNIENFEVFDSEENNKIHYKLNIANEGNREIKEIAKIKVYDDLEIVYEEEINVDLFAYENKEIVGNFDLALERGKYNVDLEFGDETKGEEFSIVKENNIIIEGQIEEVNFDETHVEVYFRNTGASVIEVYLHTKIDNKGSITGNFDILPGEVHVFEKYYELREENQEYDLELEIMSENYVIDEVSDKVYKQNAVSLEVNFYIIFGLILTLLFTSHYVLKRRKK
ncbi:MAG: hypothetical protein ISS01_02390 [Nanoarchaeota archaeon]|nr:hypothetical protein [Nanoarchaeota archaeon]